MKKNIASLVIGTVLLVSTNTLIAQQTDSKELPGVTVTSDAPKMSAIVLASFEKDFKGAANVTWYKLDKNFLIKFILGEIDQKVLYSAMGRQIYHISDLKQKFTPDDIRNLMNINFPGYSIIGTTRVEQDNRAIYVVNLENKNSEVVARVENSEAEMITKIKRDDF